MEKWNIPKVKIFEIEDLYKIFTIQNEGNWFWAGLSELKVQFGSPWGLEDFEIGPQLLQGLQNMTQLTGLALNFSSCKNITDEGVWSLASQGLQNLTQLTSLALDFNWC